MRRQPECRCRTDFPRFFCETRDTFPPPTSSTIPLPDPAKLLVQRLEHAPTTGPHRRIHSPRRVLTHDLHHGPQSWIQRRLHLRRQLPLELTFAVFHHQVRKMLPCDAARFLRLVIEFRIRSLFRPRYRRDCWVAKRGQYARVVCSMLFAEDRRLHYI